MPLRLAKIVQDRLLPAVGDGGQAIVLSRFDPLPETQHAPFAVSVVSGVVDNQELIAAGELIRRWANSWVNQYCEIINKMGADDGTEMPMIDPPKVIQDGDSQIFGFPEWTGDDESDDTESLDVESESPDVDVQPDPRILIHWRLSGDVLALGSSLNVTKAMLKPKPPIPSDRGLDPIDGVVRAITWIDAKQIAKTFDNIVAEGSAEESAEGSAEEADAYAKLIRCIDCFHQMTTTANNQTIRRWKLSMPLGNPE